MTVRQGRQRGKPQGKPRGPSPKAQQQPQEQIAKEESSSSSEDSSESEESSAGEPAPPKKDSSGDEESSSNDEESGEPKAPFFSDKNALWLKPKAKKEELLSSDNDDASSSDSHDSIDEADRGGQSDDELLDVEKEAQMIDDEVDLEREEAEEELKRTVREHTSTYHLATTDAIERDGDRVVPPSELRSHVDSILEVLADFKNRREPGKARNEYVDRLGFYLAELHGYLPELIEYFLTMFGPTETVEFVSLSDKPRPLVIRTNTLRTRRKDLAAALIKRGVTLDPLANWSKVGLKIVESPVPIGATPEYLSGMYMLQSAASMCPVLALSPEPNERILDMSAAPGGKTSYIAQLMKNSGVIFANDLKAERQKATVANMHRLGVKNVITCTHDGRKLGTLYKNRFDRILLDAPCSGLGVISRDPSVKVQRTMADVNKCAHLQKELLLSALDALKCKGTSGGAMVYSTCSVSVAENEEVIQYALSKRDIRIIETGLDFGKPGFTRFQQKRFSTSMALTRRFYPHVHNMDGFFVAKIQKLSDKLILPGNVEAQGDNDADKPMATKDEHASKPQNIKRKAPAQSEQVYSSKAPKNDNFKVSVPPASTKPKTKKNRNAKVTKPRRVGSQIGIK